MHIAIVYNHDLNNILHKCHFEDKELDGLISQLAYDDQTVQNLYNCFKKSGHTVILIDADIGIIEDLKLFYQNAIECKEEYIAYNLAHGIQGEGRYAHVPSILEMLGIPYIGSGPNGQILALNKAAAKMILQNANISTPDFELFSKNIKKNINIEFPAIVKPNSGAESYGLKIVNHDSELQDAVNFILDNFEDNVLVEKFIKGREFSVSVIGNGDELTVLPIVEIGLGKDDTIHTVYDKNIQPKQKICPANISKSLENKIVEASKKAFQLLNQKDYTRVDIRVDEYENIYILEINSLASIEEIGSFIKAANTAGYSFCEFMNKILKISLKRYESKK